MAVVKLLSGYYWDCPCGQRNFGESVPVEFNEEDRREIAEREGVDPDELRNGMFVQMPDEVTCSKCRQEHEPFDPREADGEQWYDEPNDDK